MEIHFDVWLDHQGKAFGEECFRLLEAVEEIKSNFGDGHSVRRTPLSISLGHLFCHVR
ncbi:MAG: hypothetical protein A4E58_03327 [Syntrophorhabdus sp. PtaB.Bin006]|nr:MAG: hypothetical protein A4E58_03327 [Syntrophorhabdus sp. PtaB.Bin006]